MINPLLKAINSPYLLGTPEADILTPVLKILVNVGYDDVPDPAAALDDELSEPDAELRRQLTSPITTPAVLTGRTGEVRARRASH